MFRSVCNHLVFPIRQMAWRWRRRPYSERLEAPAGQSILKAELAPRLSSKTLRLNCLYLHLFRQIPELRGDLNGDILDVGSMNFFYAPALTQFLVEQDWNGERLVGIEADSKRLYRDFYRREDYAQYYCQISSAHFGKTIRYWAGNFLNWSEEKPVSFISCLFPFLYADLNDKWGLPRSFFRPLDLYQKLQSLSPKILFFHQGEEELADSLRMIDRLGGGEVWQGGPFQENPWIPRRHPVFILLWKPSYKLATRDFTA